MKSYLKKNNNWLYVSGITLYVLGIILSTIFDKDVSMEDNPIIGMISQMNGWIMLIYIAVIAPILEEISFRSWTVNKKWTKYLSLILSSIFLLLANPYIGGIYFLSFLAVIVFLKNKPKPTLISLILITTIGFTLAHIGNFERDIFLISTPVYIGITFVFTYIALRYKLRYSMIAHALYNFSLLLLGGFIIPFGNSIILNEGNYEGSLKPVSGLYSKKGTDNYGGYSANISKTMLPEIISMLEFDSDYKIKTYPKGYSFYNLEVKTKDTLNKIDLKALSEELKRKANIRIDTLVELREVYHLEIKDVDIIKLNEDDFSDLSDIKLSIELDYIIKTIGRHYDKTIRIPDKYKGLKIIDINKFLNITSDITFEQTLKDLEKEYGITLTPKPTKIKTIRIFEEI
ncbi:MAG: CPBP family intramembrane metalloprotease [Bacteroidales bacterium]|nr:CPBP family intramembrane metalloprotease [Bacteroidales bacterium]MDD4684008.1 CPBP family intramembrane metalloprotease [Bacteroidales bacterium]